MNYPIDLLRSKVNLWHLYGLNPNFEKEWRTVSGHNLKINFTLQKPTILNFRFTYFPTTNPQNTTIYIDGQKLEGYTRGQQDIFWQSFSSGNHTVIFHFQNVRRPGEMKGDSRHLAAAFTNLSVDKMADKQSVNLPVYILVVALIVFFGYTLRIIKRENHAYAQPP